MIISWFFHSCFKLESDGYSIVVDPFDEVSGYPEPQLNANAVFASHDHHDHNNIEAVTIDSHIGEPKIKVNTIPCFHDTNMGKDRGNNLIHIFEAEGMRVAHLGDLGHVLTDEQVNALKHCDALLIPVGGFYTIDAKAAYEICQKVEPRVIVPMHYQYGGRGLKQIASPEEFLDLFPSEMIKVYDKPVIELTPETEAHIAFLG